MPRPEIEQELVDQWESEFKAAEQTVDPDLLIVFSSEAVKAKIHESVMALKWLRAEFKKLEVDDKTISQFYTAFGKRCLTAPDVWELAQKTLEIYKANRQKMIANMPPPYTTRILPSEQVKELYEFYIRVHPEEASYHVAENS
jgi:hypothetical protein